MSEREVLTDAAWQFNEAVSMLRMARAAVVALEDAQEIDEGLPAMQSALEGLAALLESPDIILIRKVDGEWPEWAVNALDARPYSSASILNALLAAQSALSDSLAKEGEG